MKYAFLRDELSGSCTTRMACRLLEVSPSGYYHFLKAQLAPRKQRRLAIEQAVVRVHAESRRIYGAPKITHELPKLGLVAHRNTVSCIIRIAVCSTRVANAARCSPCSAWSRA